MPPNLIDLDQRVRLLDATVSGSSSSGGTTPPVVGGPYLPLAGVTPMTGQLVVGAGGAAITGDVTVTSGTVKYPFLGSSVNTEYEKLAGVTIPRTALDHWRHFPTPARTTLTTALTTGTTTMVVDLDEYFPKSGAFVVKIGDEECLVTAGQGTGTWTIRRAVNFTTDPGTTYAAGTPISTSGVMRICSVGDSLPAGYDGVSTYIDSYIDQMRRVLGQPSIGRGFRGIWNIDFTKTTGGAAAWTYVPAGDPEDIGPYATVVAGSVATATGATAIYTWTPQPNMTVGQVDIYYVETTSTGQGSYSVDGGTTWTNLPTDPPASGARLQKYPVVVTSPTNVKVRAANAAGTGHFFAFAGVSVWNQPVTFETVGLVVDNIVMGGAPLHVMTESSRTDGMRFFEGDAASLRPALMLCHFANDPQYNDLTQWATDITTFVTRAKSFGSDVLWMLTYELLIYASALEASYRATLKGLAPTAGLEFAVLDVYDAWTALTGTAGYAAANAYGLLGADGVHASQAGHDDLSARMLRLLAFDGGLINKIDATTSSGTGKYLRIDGGANTGTVTFGLAYTRLTAPAGIPGMILQRVNGSIGSPTTLTSGQYFGEFSIAGQYDSTVGHVRSGVRMVAQTTAAWTSSTGGAQLQVYTARDDTGGTAVLSTTFDQDQSVILQNGIRGVVDTPSAGYQVIPVRGDAKIPGLAMTRVNGTGASPTKITSGQFVGGLYAGGQYDTTVGHARWGTAILSQATADYASGSGGTKLLIYTSPDSTGTLTLGATFGADGSLSVVGDTNVSGIFNALAAANLTGAVHAYSTVQVDSTTTMTGLLTCNASPVAASFNSAIAVTGLSPTGICIVANTYGNGSQLADTIDLRTTRGADATHLAHMLNNDVLAGLHVGATSDTDYCDVAQIYCTATEDYWGIPSSISNGASDVTADTITSAGHPFSDTDEIVFLGLTNTTGIVDGTHYFVRDSTTNTFKVAATSGGAAINLTGSNDSNLVVSKGGFGNAWEFWNIEAGSAYKRKVAEIADTGAITGYFGAVIAGITNVVDLDALGDTAILGSLDVGGATSLATLAVSSTTTLTGLVTLTAGVTGGLSVAGGLTVSSGSTSLVSATLSSSLIVATAAAIGTSLGVGTTLNVVGVVTAQSGLVVFASAPATQTTSYDLVDIANATAITNNAASLTAQGVVVAPVMSYSQSPGSLVIAWRGFYDDSTHQGTAGGASRTAGSYLSFVASPLFKTTDTNAQTFTASSAFVAVPTFSVFAAGSLTVTTLRQFTGGNLAVPTGATITTFNQVDLLGPAVTGTITTRRAINIADGSGAGTFTTQVGIDIAAMTAAGTNIGIRNASSLLQTGNVGFFGATAVGQQTNPKNTAVTTAGSTNGVFRNTTFTGGSGSTDYTIGDLVLAMKNLGFIAT